VPPSWRAPHDRRRAPTLGPDTPTASRPEFTCIGRHWRGTRAHFGGRQLCSAAAGLPAPLEPNNIVIRALSTLAFSTCLPHSHPNTWCHSCIARVARPSSSSCRAVAHQVRVARWRNRPHAPAFLSLLCRASLPSHAPTAVALATLPPTWQSDVSTAFVTLSQAAEQASCCRLDCEKRRPMWAALVVRPGTCTHVRPVLNSYNKLDE
jgi:hypothetical protein